MKTIKIQSVQKVMVPVIRNGKPTKRMKVSWEIVEKEVELDSIEHEGHRVYFIPNKDVSLAYREDGEILTADFIYGAYGKELHTNCLSVRNGKLNIQSVGYSGPTGKGSYARLIRINW